MSSRFHNKWHRHNHHTYASLNPLYPDSSHDPIASPDSPFFGDFVLQGGLSASATLSSYTGYFQNNNTNILLASPTYCISGNGLTYLKGDTSLVGTVYVDGNTNINSDVTMERGFVNSDFTVYGNLSVLGQVSQVNITQFSNISTINIQNYGAGPVLDILQGGVYPIVRISDEAGVVFFIPDNGNTGIKTTIPNKELTVNGEISATNNVTFDKTALIGGNTTIVGLLSSNNATLNLLNAGNIAVTELVGTNSKITNLSALNLSATNYRGVISDTSSLRLGVSGVEHMRITNSGNVGIGTPNPSVKLALSASTFNGVVYTGWINGVVEQYIGVGANIGLIGTTTNHPIKFLTNNGDRLYISSTGNIGINTTSPKAILDVSGPVVENYQNVIIGAGSGGTILDLNLNTAAFFKVVLTSNITQFNITYPPNLNSSDNKVLSFSLQTQGDSGSPTRTINWLFNNYQVRWSDGVAPTITTTANKIDTYTFITYDAGANWFGFISGQNM